jgi:predicted nucleotidyltransferase
MIETLISSKTRIKLLLKFFLNSNTSSYLRGLETELGESSNGIRLELNRFEKAGMLTSYNQGNKKYFKANQNHPLFKDVHNIVLKYIGFDKIIEKVIERLGDVSEVYIIGDFAKGKDSSIIDLLFIGKVNKNYLIELIEKAEKLIKRKIRYVCFESLEHIGDGYELNIEDSLLLWSLEDE